MDGAQRNKDDLEELQMLCTVLTAQVIEKCSAGKTLAIDVTPLTRCVRKLELVAGRYSGRGILSRMANFRRDGDDIRRLRSRIRDVVPILGLAATTHVSDQLERMQSLLVSHDRWGDYLQLMACAWESLSRLVYRLSPTLRG